jgi:hypothetical protein
LPALFSVEPAGGPITSQGLTIIDDSGAAGTDGGIAPNALSYLCF